jgi:site-specific DNA recombinase
MNAQDKTRERTRKSVLRQMAMLRSMSLDQLREKWLDLYGTEPPKYKKQFLIKRLAYRIQELFYGGLSEQAKAHLRRVALKDPVATVNRRIPEERKTCETILPGTRFVRIWKDRRYEVVAQAEGFEYDGRIFKSLSAVAREITGTSWNGKVFFGLNKIYGKKKLVVNHEEAQVVQYIYRRFIQLGSAKKMGRELNDQGYRTKSWTTKKGKVRKGVEWNTGHIYRLLSNRIYIGEIVHKEKSYPGEHDGIVDRQTWDKAQAILADNKQVKVSMARTKMVAPLKGVIRCGHCGCAMGPTYTRNKDRQYTYYICEKDAKRTVSRCPLKRVPAGDIEQAVIEQLSAVFRTPTLVAKTYFAAREIESMEKDRLIRQKSLLEEELAQARRQALELMKPENDQPNKEEMLATVNSRVVDLSRQLTHVAERCKAYQSSNISEQDVSEAFQNVETFWQDLFPVERNRLIRLLVNKVEIRETGIDIELRTNGLTTLIAELAGLACEVNERRAN